MILTKHDTKEDIVSKMAKLMSSTRHIDRIAREKNRDVVFVTFETEENSLFKAPFFHRNTNWRSDKNRLTFVKWLNDNNIKYEEAAAFACENGWSAYNGNIYVEVPFDESDENYQKIQRYLENSDGSRRNPLVGFWYCALEDALKNRHHDEPGFWDKWAETF